MARASSARGRVSCGWIAARAGRFFPLMREGGHVPVLLEEAVAALAVKPAGIYVDATFGRGGHSRRILTQLDARGRLIALDRDPAAEAVARSWSDPRFRFHRAPFSELPQVVDAERIGNVDGVLLDLGVSSTPVEE